jgi:hypothetical protein
MRVKVAVWTDDVDGTYRDISAFNPAELDVFAR